MWGLFLVISCIAGLVVLFRVRELRQVKPRSAAIPRLHSLLTLEQSNAEDDVTLFDGRLGPKLSAELAPRIDTTLAPLETSAEASHSALLAEVLEEAQLGECSSAPEPREARIGGSRALLLREADAVDDERTGPVARVLVLAQGDSDRGRVRRRNEDSLLLLPEHALFAIADGMGGYAGGQVASSLAVEAVRNAFVVGEKPQAPVDSVVPRRGQELALALIDANRAVYDAANSDPTLAQMGTTLVAARFALNKQRLYVGHVGDSRCYRLRGNELRQLTHDHTMAELGLVGPRAGDLSRALGMEADVTLDLLIDRPRIGDTYLLCSDGLTKMMSDQAIRDTLAGEDDLEAAVYALIEGANDAGGKDNVSVILIKVLAANATASLEHPASPRSS